MAKKSYCETQGRPIIVGHDPAKKTGFAFVPDCGMWTCPHCAQERSNLWQLTAFKGASQFMREGKEMGFITLTTRGGRGRTRDRALSALKEAFPRLRERAKYKMGTFEYIVIPEQHKNGIVHCHMVATNTLPKRWWKDNAYESGLGYMADVSKMIDPFYAPYYVAKYVGKEFAGVEWPKGFRRVRASRQWPKVVIPKAPDENEYGVFRDKGAAMWELHLLNDLGYDVKVAPSFERLFG